MRSRHAHVDPPLGVAGTTRLYIPIADFGKRYRMR